MRTNPPNDHFLQITSKELLSRSAGIVLQREGLILMKAIEATSRRSNFETGTLFQASEPVFEKLKIPSELSFDQLWELIDFGIVTQMFEIKVNKTSGEMDIFPYVVSIPDDLPSLEDAFHRLQHRSVDRIKKYVVEKKILTEEIWRLILVKISDPEYLKKHSEGDDLTLWMDPKKFPFAPSKSMLVQSRELILDGLSKEADILVIPNVGFYSLHNTQINLLLKIGYELFIAKIEPILRNLDLTLQEKLEELGRENLEITSESLDEISQIKSRMDLYLRYEPILKKKGFFLYVTILQKLCGFARKEVETNNKQETEKIFRKFLIQLENSSDFDEKFLRLNLESDDKNELDAIEQLKKNPNVLMANWHDEEKKIGVFASKNISKLIEINHLIYSRYRYTTKHILYLKALLEFNEPDIKNIFKDEDFVKTYGKNLEAVYFHYIPWYYRIFYFLNFDFITNIGYAKAKSIITYAQMDREIKYKTRRELFFKRKMREKQERVEKEKRVQQKRILVQAIEEAFFTKNTVPSVEWILNHYPIFSPQSIEKVIPDFAFIKFPNHTLTDDTVILFPKSPEFEGRYKKLMETLNLKLREVQEDDNYKQKTKDLLDFIAISNHNSP